MTTATTEDLTDEDLVTRVRGIQAELRKLDGRIGELSDEIATRRTMLRDAQDRVNELQVELHEVVAVPVRMGFW